MVAVADGAVAATAGEPVVAVDAGAVAAPVGEQPGHGDGSDIVPFAAGGDVAAVEVGSAVVGQRRRTVGAVGAEEQHRAFLRRG